MISGGKLILRIILSLVIIVFAITGLIAMYLLRKDVKKVIEIRRTLRRPTSL